MDPTFSFQSNGGVSRVEIRSPQLSLNTKGMWMMEQFENVFFDFSGNGAYGEIKKELTAHAHFWNEDNEFKKMSISMDVNFNAKDWWYVSFCCTIIFVRGILITKE